MKRLISLRWNLPGLAVGVGLILGSSAFAQDAPTTPPVPAPPAPGLAAPSVEAPPAAPEGEQPVNPEDFEYLSRGPVHEAFAEQYDANPEAGLIVAKKPPEPVDEIPPDVRPEGENVVWVPGYWAWDDEREDFIYVSGTWRIAPEGQRWVPGYWTEAPQGGDPGWQWVSGFWTPIENQELAYLPQPPQSLDNGPVGDAPSDLHFWRPGYWQYANANYRWSPGYWAQGYDNYCWIPDRYIWTPHGYIYGAGYWDGSFATRGFLYSPVFIPPRYFYRPYGFRYRPRFMVNIGNFGLHLFVRPRYRHYYYGDYYAGFYGPRFGIHYWTNWSRQRHFDPMLSFYAGYHRRHHGIDYVGRLNSWNSYYRRNENFRPPHTVRAQSDFLARNAGNRSVQSAILARDFNDAVRDMRSDRIVRLSANDVQREHRFGQELRDISRLRNSTESRVRLDSSRPGLAAGEAGRPGGDRSNLGDRRPGSAGDRGDGNRQDFARAVDRLKLPEASSIAIRTPRTGSTGDRSVGDRSATDSRSNLSDRLTRDNREAGDGTGRSLRELSGRGGERPTARPRPSVTTDNALGSRPGQSLRDNIQNPSGGRMGSTPTDRGNRPQINRPQGDRPATGSNAGSGDRPITIQPRNRPQTGSPSGDANGNRSPGEGPNFGNRSPQDRGSPRSGEAAPRSSDQLRRSFEDAARQPGGSSTRPPQTMQPRSTQPRVTPPGSNQPRSVQPNQNQPRSGSTFRGQSGSLQGPSGNRPSGGTFRSFEGGNLNRGGTGQGVRGSGLPSQSTPRFNAPSGGSRPSMGTPRSSSSQPSFSGRSSSGPSRSGISGSSGRSGSQPSFRSSGGGGSRPSFGGNSGRSGGGDRGGRSGRR